LARDAAEDGVELVVAVGGDGTVNEVGRGLIGTDAVLGLLPIGSGNAFARALHVPINPGRACRALLEPQIRRIDVGRISNRYFFSTAGIGLDAEVCWRYDRRPGSRRGLLPYVWLTVHSFLTYEPEDVAFTLDDNRTIRTRPVVATIANTAEYGDRAVIAPSARPDDGLLDLCIIEDVGLFRGFLHGPRLFTGTIDRMPGVRIHRSRTFRIVRPAPGRIQVDGESAEAGATLHVEVVPEAVRIAVPGG
jgi:YegS/Rv2252/BmrU family lipid kinase